MATWETGMKRVKAAERIERPSLEEWLRVVRETAEEIRPLLEAFKAYDKGASDEEIRRILGLGPP